MTSVNPFSRNADLTSPTNKFPHSISEPEGVMREGRSYTSLSHIQRLGRLIKILSTLVSNSFGRSLSSEDASRISKWWDEFKSGKVIIVKKSGSETPSPDLEEEDGEDVLEDFINRLVSDVKDVNEANKKPIEEELINTIDPDITDTTTNEPEIPHVDETLPTQEEQPQQEEQPLLVQEENHLSVQEDHHQVIEEDKEQSTSQSESQDHEEPELEIGIVKDEEISTPVIVPEETERQNLKQKDPELKIKPKERTEEAREEDSLPANTLSTEEEQLQLIEEDDEDLFSSNSNSEDQEEPELEVVIVKDEKMPTQVIVPEENERKDFKPKEPELNIKPKDPTKDLAEEPPHVETLPLTQDEHQQSVQEENKEQFSSGSESEDHQKHEKAPVKDEEKPIHDIIPNELDIYDVDQYAAALKIKPKKQEAPVEILKDSSNAQQNEPVEEVLDTQQEVKLSEEEAIEIGKKEREIAVAEKIKAISSAMNDENVKNWLLIAEKNLFLSHTSLYQNLKEISLKLDQKHFIDEEEFKELLIKHYTDYEDKILAIRNTPANKLDKSIQRQENEFVFNFLKDREPELNKHITLLKDHANGKFKANLQALLNLIASPISSPSSSSSSDEEQSLEKSVHLNEVALEATLKSVDPVKAFADFEDQINQDVNQPAKEAFIIFIEILKAGAIAKNLPLRLKDYNEAEAAVQKAIIDLAKPLQDIANDSLGKQLPITLDTFNQIFKSFPSLNKKPFLKNLLIQNTRNAATAFLILEDKSSKTFSSELSQKLALAIYNLKTHLGAKKKKD